MKEETSKDVWEKERVRKERIEGERGRRPPLAGLSGAVRMMNGSPARAVRALMGAAELYITLLSVCERLLKALISPGCDTGPQNAPPPHPQNCRPVTTSAERSASSPPRAAKKRSGRSGAG